MSNKDKRYVMHDIVVVVSADTEWRALQEIMPVEEQSASPFGGWFVKEIGEDGVPVVFFHGGWGKIAAAASAQYVMDRWQPKLLVNLGTCGGFQGEIERGTIVLAERTIVYDILEQMGDPDKAIEYYSTDIDLDWLDGGYPMRVHRGLLVSGDRDLVVEEIPALKARFGAVAGDWESGAIAWVAERNGARCLILRGVSDLVGSDGGEAYDGNIDVFVESAREIMKRLLDALPDWISKVV